MLWYHKYRASASHGVHVYTRDLAGTKFYYTDVSNLPAVVMHSHPNQKSNSWPLDSRSNALPVMSPSKEQSGGLFSCYTGRFWQYGNMNHEVKLSTLLWQLSFADLSVNSGCPSVFTYICSFVHATRWSHPQLTGSQLVAVGVFAVVEKFRLQARALHVFNEAERVLKFKAVCDRGGGSDGSDSLAELGRLMYASHESCRDLYECSCRELDQLVELAMCIVKFVMTCGIDIVL